MTKALVGLVDADARMRGKASARLGAPAKRKQPCGVEAATTLLGRANLSDAVLIANVAPLVCGLNGSMHHRGRVKIVIASGPPTPVEEWATACRVAPVEI